MANELEDVLAAAQTANVISHSALVARGVTFRQPIVNGEHPPDLVDSESESGDDDSEPESDYDQHEAASSSDYDSDSSSDSPYSVQSRDSNDTDSAAAALATYDEFPREYGTDYEHTVELE